MPLVKVTCSFCNKKYYRPSGRFNEAKKFGWKQYCSKQCQTLAKNKQVTMSCGNPSCNNTFKRQRREIPKSGVCFCSKSCSAIVNNSKSVKRQKKIRICPNCSKEFTGRRKYCSPECYPKRTVISKETIIAEIKEFFKENNRIPFKREYHAYKMARFYFSTWNKAIKAAGFEPNPVKFAKKYTAKDGHVCDSLSEKIVDDWLSSRKISHRINVPYLGTKFTADFKVKDCFIEFFGLHGELKQYDFLMKEKLKLIKKYNLSLIAIYPKDIFREKRLSQILGSLE
ncbi:MAG TPA: hypothetical protein VMW25_06000 [Clostridia bacterium]|nr:hypothetical protein [Clostridia bacterium]